MSDNRKVILAIIDGAGYDSCVREYGFLEGLVERNEAYRWKMQVGLPSISGPMYETIHTGLSPIDHGITCNENLRPSNKPNIFSAVSKAGLTTSAVAQSYFYTLYAGRAYNKFTDVEHSNPDVDLHYGRFYSMESYSKMNICAPAEIDLCAQTLKMISDHKPDYLMLHTCSVDSIGHAYGGDSREYRRQISMVDGALGRVIPLWQAEGYDVIVTADHGMNAEGNHGGTEDIVRHVPFYWVPNPKHLEQSDTFLPKLPTHDKQIEQTTLINQLAIAPFVLELMGVEIPETMQARLHDRIH